MSFRWIMVNPSTSKEKHGNAKSKELSLNLDCIRIYTLNSKCAWSFIYVLYIKAPSLQMYSLHFKCQTSVLSGCFPKSGVVIPVTSYCCWCVWKFRIATLCSTSFPHGERGKVALVYQLWPVTSPWGSRKNKAFQRSLLHQHWFIILSDVWERILLSVDDHRWKIHIWIHLNHEKKQAVMPSHEILIFFKDCLFPGLSYNHRQKNRGKIRETSINQAGFMLSPRPTEDIIPPCPRDATTMLEKCKW